MTSFSVAKSVCLLSFVLGIGIVSPARGDEMAAQTGMLECKVISKQEIKCPRVSFKPAFGETPNVIVTVSGYATSPNGPPVVGIDATVQAGSVTRDGFQPVCWSWSSVYISDCRI